MLQKFHAVFLFIFAFYSASAQAAPAFLLTDLGTFGGANSIATALNEKGQVVGWAEALDYSSPATARTVEHAFLYDSGGMTDIHSLGSLYSKAWGINENGVVVGDFFTENYGWGAFLFDGSQTSAIPDLRSAYDVNDSGQIAGNTALSPVLYSDGVVTGLRTFDQGMPSGVARRLNNSGQIVGQADTTSYDNYGHKIYHAFLSNGNAMTDLGTLGGYYSVANDVNNNGIVVGSAETGGYVFSRRISHAFLYSNGSMVDLGTLPGSASSYAIAINDNGVIVGEADNGHAFIYRNGNMLDLNDLVDPLSGFTIDMATDINNSGQIAATGCNAEGCHALLLTPVPEPGVYAMIIVGLTLVTMYSKAKVLAYKSL